MKCIRSIRIGALTLALCCLQGIGFGQSNDQGEIRGTISDSRGAVIPGASVTLVDAGTNVAQKTTSNDHGLYVLPHCARPITGCWSNRTVLGRWRRRALLLM